MSRKDKSPLEHYLSLYVFDNFDSPSALVHAVVLKEDRVRDVLNTKPSNGKAENDPPITVKMIEVQQQDNISRTAKTQVRQGNSKFTVSQEGLLVHKAHIDAAIQVVLPPSLRHYILLMLHYSPLAG